MGVSGTWTRERRLDALGLTLVVLLALWTWGAAGGGSGRPAPVLWLLGGMTLVFTTARAASWRRGSVHRLVAVGVAGTFALTWPGVLGAGGAPTGYGNTNATIASLGALAAIGASVHSAGPAVRRAWVGLAAVLSGLTALTGSVAGTACLAVTLALLGLSFATRWPAWSIVGGAIVVVTVLGVTIAIALGGDPAGLRELAGVRADLWSAAADVLREEPVHGVGAGGFAPRNPVSTDPDLRWAHHGYLQAGAEYGIVGLALILALLSWLLTQLWRTSGSCPELVVVGAAALNLVLLHAAVDHVAHAPAVPLVSVALCAVGCARHRDGSIAGLELQSEHQR